MNRNAEMKKCDQLMGLYVARISQLVREPNKGAAEALRRALANDRPALWLEGAGSLDNALLAAVVGFDDWKARAVRYLDDVRGLLAHRATL